MHIIKFYNFWTIRTILKFCPSWLGILRCKYCWRRLWYADGSSLRIVGVIDRCRMSVGAKAIASGHHCLCVYADLYFSVAMETLFDEIERSMGILLWKFPLRVGVYFCLSQNCRFLEILAVELAVSWALSLNAGIWLRLLRNLLAIFVFHISVVCLCRFQGEIDDLQRQDQVQ